MNADNVPPLSEVFTFFFRPYIRVQFNWQRMEQEKWPIRLLLIDELPELAKLYMPWHIDETGSVVDYAAPMARPIQVQDIPDVISRFDNRRQEHIQELTEAFKQAGEPVQLVLAAYCINRNTYLLLDGSHRAAAVILAQVPFRLIGFVIVGPVEADVVSDLGYWEGKAARHDSSQADGYPCKEQQRQRRL